MQVSNTSVALVPSLAAAVHAESDGAGAELSVYGEEAAAIHVPLPSISTSYDVAPAAGDQLTCTSPGLDVVAVTPVGTEGGSASVVKLRLVP